MDFNKNFCSSLVVLKPNAITHVGTLLDILHAQKFTVSRMRYIRLDHENAYLNPEIVGAEVRSSLQGGPSVVFEVLKSVAVESLQTLLHQEVPKHIAGASYDSLFFAPSNFKDAETVRYFDFSAPCLLYCLTTIHNFI